MIIFENATIQMRGIPDCIFLCIEQGHLFSIIILQCPDLSFVWVEVLVKVLVIILYYIIYYISYIVLVIIFSIIVLQRPDLSFV